MKDLKRAVLLLEEIHAQTTELLGSMARNEALGGRALYEARRLSVRARSMATACGVEVRLRPSEPPLAPPEGQTTYAACSLHARTSALLLACARTPLTSALGDPTVALTICAAADEFLRSMGLEPLTIV